MAKQAEIPGTEKQNIKEISEAADEYVKARDRLLGVYQSLVQEEVRAKEKIDEEVEKKNWLTAEQASVSKQLDKIAAIVG